MTANVVWFGMQLQRYAVVAQLSSSMH